MTRRPLNELGESVRYAWKAYVRRAAAYQAETILSVVYFTVLGPSALVARIARRRSFFGPPGWRARSARPHTIDEHARQF